MQQLENALKAVPQVSLAALPTPFMRMENLEKKLNHAGIFIKRDDLTGLGPGGNKLRSLEFLLGEAMEQSADTVIAAGPPQSNLCTLTAAACAKLALRCVLVHNGDKPPHEEGNILLNRLLGAQSHYLGNVSAQERTACAEQLSQELAVNHRTYVVKNGATTGRGALGYVKAIPELQRQTASLGLAGLTIFAPGGNGGVAAGLICGNALCGFPFRIVIISVENDCQTLTQDIRRTVAEAADCLRLPHYQEYDRDRCAGHTGTDVQTAPAEFHLLGRLRHHRLSADSLARLYDLLYRPGCRGISAVHLYPPEHCFGKLFQHHCRCIHACADPDRLGQPPARVQHSHRKRRRTAEAQGGAARVKIRSA